MNHQTITTAFYVSLLIVMPVGLALMILWAWKVVKPLSKGIEKSGRINLHEIAFKGLIYMLPGILIFVLFSIPVIYFNYLLKQETFCKQMIEVNKLTRTNTDLEQRCGRLDINELLENSKAKK